MTFVVSYSVYACDDFVAERVSRRFTDFLAACDYFAECELTEDDCRISVEQPQVEHEALPF